MQTLRSGKVQLASFACVNATDLTKKIAVPTPRLPSYTKKWLYFSGQSVPRLFK